MIPAVVLAAGKSMRMGRPKALLPAGSDETFLTRIIRTLHEAGIDEVVVVLGHDAQAISESVAARGLSPRFVVNDDYESGQLSSLLAGLEVIDRPDVSAVLLTLVDAPLVSPDTVRAIVERYRRTQAPVVRPVQQVQGAPGEVQGVQRGRHGHPVVLDRRLFALLRSASASAGAKPIVRAHASAYGDVQIDDEGAFDDVDTPEDYVRLLERSEARRR